MVDTTTLIAMNTAISAAADSVGFILPIDLAELLRALFYGVSILCIPVATVYIMLTNRNVVTLAKQMDGLLEDRDKAHEAKGVKKGVEAGEATAATLEEGRRLGAEAERASAAAQTINTPAAGDSPLPVIDQEAVKIAGRVATAMEDSAVSQQKIAAAAETKPADKK